MKPGDVVEDRFELESIAGSGGMGTVFRARDRSTGEHVALKLLRVGSPDALERFAREIRVLAALRHPGIVRHVADGKLATGEPWLAMEWLAGESLQERLARAGLTAAESVDLARRVAEALGAAHERGVVHRDVKPSNLFLPGGDLDAVKVLDFGVARVTDAGRASTRTGVMIGTPGYMSPEQVRGDRDVGVRADVFALGCVLFECLSGRVAFTGDNMMAVLAKIYLEDAPRITELRADLPAALDALVARALAKRPEDRPRDGAQLAAELTALARIDIVERAATHAAVIGLTATEQRLLCVVLIASAGHVVTTINEAPDRTTIGWTPWPADDVPTIAEQTATPEMHALQAAAEAHGAKLDRLVDGSYVVTLAGTGGASDQAVAAARCALALKLLVPEAPMALATGRGVMAGSWPVGEAIDRAASLHAAAASAPHLVRLDEVTAGLLDHRFEVGGDDAGLALIRERDVVEVVRTLLGKPTPCVGRDRELGVLYGLYEECVSEPMARAVLVTGGPGVGKSRVRYELLRRIKELAETPVEVWIGRGEHLRAGSPYGMIAPALRRSAGILDGEPLEVRRKKLRARVFRHTAVDISRTAIFLGELIGAPFPDEDSVELRAARQDPLLMVDQINRAFEHFIGIETTAQPLVIVFEDLHLGDDPTVKLIDAALRALPDRPWFVLALARPEVHELFPRLWGDRGVQELRLDELTRKSSDKLVRRVLGDAASDTLVARIVEQAGGNAFYLEELIRAAAEGKGDALPATVLAIVHSRLERLEGDARRVLRAASVFGQHFWRGGVTALLGGDARQTNARAWLDELVEREVIARAAVSRFPAEEEYTFRNSLVREAAYAMLTDADRRLGHKLAGAWLERAGEGEPMVLAGHFERGDDLASARDCYQRAAEQALAACDFRGAAARAERGVACGAKGEQLGALSLAAAEAHKWCGEFAKAARDGFAAMALLPPGSAAWFAAANEAVEGSGKLADIPRLRAIGETLRDAPEHDDENLANRVTATAHAAFQLFSHGEGELAIVLLDRVEALAGRVVDPGILARIYQARSTRAMITGDAGAYLESEHAAVLAFERAGDRRYACMQRGHVGYACLEIGAPADAERWLREAMAIAKELGLSNVIATAKHNLGRALMHRGQLAEALAIETEAFEAFHAQGDRRLEGAARLYLGYIYSELGDPARAELEFRLSLETAQAPLRPQILASIARVQLARGESDEALVLAREAADLLEQLGAIEEGESLVRLVLAEALAANGQHGAARGAARRARDRLLARAAKISDPEWRETFLNGVPDNARTLKLDV